MKQLFISNADFVLPLNGIDYLLRHFFLWSDNTSALSLDGILRLFSKSETLLFFWLTNSALLTGYFYIAFVLIFCGISIYTFLKRFLNVPKYPAMVGALVFLINPAFLGNYSKIGLILSASALPLALVCLKSFLATQRFKYLIYIILLLNLSLLHPFTFIVNTFVLVVYVVYHYKKVLNYQGIVRIFTAGLLFLLLSLYFVLPLISLGTVSKDSIQNTFTRGGEAVDYTQIVDVASAGGYVNGLALSKDVFLDFDFYSDKSQAIFYFSNYLLLIFIVSFFLFGKKNITFLIFTSCFLLLVALSSVGSEIIANILKWGISNLPGGWSLRSPLKWQLYAPMCLAGMLALSIHGVRRYGRMVGFFVGIIILSINGYVLLDIKEKLLTPKNLGAYEEIYTELVEATNLLVVRNTDCIEKTPRSDHSIINEIITSLTAGIYNVTDRTMEDVPVFAFDYILACADITKYTESNFNNIKTAGNFTLYKNSTPIKDIADFAQIYLFEKNTNYLQKSDFLLNKYGEGIDFYMPVATSTIPAYGLSLAYENIMPQNISDGKLTEIHKNTSPTTLYVNTSSADVYFRPTKNGFSIERGSSAQISVNGNIISPGPINPEILYQSQGDDLSNFIQIGSRLVIPDRASSTPIFLGTAESSIEILSAATSSVVQNGSFEDGLWSEQVSDCNNYDDNGKIAQRISSEVYSGVNSLELEATRHIACTGLSSVDVTEGQEYILSFAYQSPNAKQAGYYVGMRGATTTVITEKLPFTDTEWHTHHKRFTIPEGVKNLSLNLYSYATDNVTPIIVRYDDVVLKRVAVVRMIDPRREDRFVPTDLGSAETNTLTLADPIHNFKENINNGDFSKGFWNKTVGDCNNYDENGKLDMRLVDDERDGGKSLELEATRHTACTGPKMMPVTEGTLYLLSFDYQSENAKEAGYYIGWSGATSTTPVNERIPIKDVEWHTFTKQIKVPSGASSASLSVYTYEKDGKIPIKVRYDNFNFIELPDIANRYYLVSDPQTNFVEPQSVSFDLVNPTKKLVHIRGATTPFYLAMSESFHSQWQAQFSNEKVKGFLHSWVPWVKPDMISEENHFKLNGFLNGWYFDTQKYCEMENLCTKNPDGSYNVELVLEFFPQRWFYIGLLISGTTLVSCLGYLGYDSIRRRRKRRVVLRSSMRIQQAE